MSKIYVDEIAGIASPSTVAIPGHVIQVVSADTNDVFSSSSTSFVDVTGLTVDITPQSSSSKFLITGHVMLSGGEAGSFTQMFRFAKTISGTTTGLGEGGYGYGYPDRSNNAFSVKDSHTYLDSPATTSTITYSLQVRLDNASTWYVNRTVGRSNTGASSITVMEIAG